MALVFAAVTACQPTPSQPEQATGTPPVPVASPSPNSPSAEPPPTPLPSGVARALTIPLTDPDGHYRLEVTVLDRTGLAESVESFVREQMPEGLQDAPAPEQGLEYMWETGACARHATLTFERLEVGASDGHRFRLTNVVDRSVDACTLNGVVRAIRIRTSRSIPAADIDLVEHSN